MPPGVSLVQRESCLHSEAHAQLTAELVVGDHNAALDDDLARRGVDLADYPSHVFETGSGIRYEQDIAAGIDDRDTTLRDNRALAAGGRGLPGTSTVRLLPVARNQVYQVLCLDVVELERFRHQWLEIADLLLGFELLLLLDGKLLARCDQNDVAVLAHVEALGLHDDVQCLIPRDILQAQRQAAGHGVAGDDVQAGEVGDHLQHRAHFDVLEVEREFFTLVAGARALRQLVRIFLDRLDLDDESVVGLIGGVLPEALGLDDHPRVAALRKRVDADHGCREVTDVQATLEVARHCRLDEIDDQRLALLPDIDTRGVVRQVDDDASFAVLSAAEIDVSQYMRRLARARLGKSRHGGLRIRRHSARSVSVISTVLPSTCVSNDCGALRLKTTRVRFPA